MTARKDDSDDDHGQPPNDADDYLVDDYLVDDDDGDDNFHTPPETPLTHPHLINIHDFMRAWQAGHRFTAEERARICRMLEADNYATTLVMAGGNCTIPLHGPNSHLDQLMRIVCNQYSNVRIDKLDVSDGVCMVIPNEVTQIVIFHFPQCCSRRRNRTVSMFGYLTTTNGLGFSFHCLIQVITTLIANA